MPARALQHVIGKLQGDDGVFTLADPGCSGWSRASREWCGCTSGIVGKMCANASSPCVAACCVSVAALLALRFKHVVECRVRIFKHCFTRVNQSCAAFQKQLRIQSHLHRTCIERVIDGEFAACLHPTKSRKRPLAARCFHLMRTRTFPIFALYLMRVSQLL